MSAMRESRIGWAFTADGHFDRVGKDLRALLQRREDGRVIALPLPFAK